MAVPVRLNDEVYAEVKELAAKQGRSVANYVNYVLAHSRWHKIPSEKDLGSYLETVPDETREAAAKKGDVADLIRPEPVETLEKKIAGGKPLTKGEALTAIRAREAELKADLEFCQDPETRSRLEDYAKADIDALWAEYHSSEA